LPLITFKRGKKMISIEKVPRLTLFPSNVNINDRNHLVIDGYDTVDLTAEFGTPLYVFDENNLRKNCAEFKREFGKYYPETNVIYAAKAFLDKYIARLLKEEEIGLDVVSLGEASIAHSAGFPLEKAFLHGNNKSADDLKVALQWGIGRIVVDNFYELNLLNKIAGEMSRKPDILLRLTPGVDPHTHKYVSTGIIDSKFGFPLIHGDEAVSLAMSLPNINLIGLHCHIGSLIFEVNPYIEAIENMLNVAGKVKQKYGFILREFDIGGGFAVQYTVDNPAPPISAYSQAISNKIISKCRELNINLPELIVEPGRSLIAKTGIALYTFGAIKNIPQVRTYASVDGGMGDNIRPAIYGSEYEAVLANKAGDSNTDKYTIAGKYCESGDILIQDIMLPKVTAGDILAIPVCGAYCIPMSSNYNASLKPAVVVIKDSKAQLIHRRETYADLVDTDVV
jgi:diaminopimelate decarboxylase